MKHIHHEDAAIHHTEEAKHHNEAHKYHSIGKDGKVAFYAHSTAGGSAKSNISAREQSKIYAERNIIRA